jgi:hypothetical protein
MKKLSVILACSLLLFPFAAGAQSACPCVPITHLWIVDACESWNCAAAATIMSNGDKYLLTLPTNSDDFKWAVVRRVAAGSAAVSPDAPFRVEAFDSASDATARFEGLGHDFEPIMLSAPDGKFLVLARSTAASARKRAAKP